MGSFPAGQACARPATAEKTAFALRRAKYQNSWIPLKFKTATELPGNDEEVAEIERYSLDLNTDFAEAGRGQQE